MNTPTRAASLLLSHLAPLAIALLAAIPAAAQGDLENKALTISDLTATHAPAPRLPFHTLLGLRNCDYWRSHIPATQEHEPALEGDSLITALSMLDDGMEHDGVEVRPESGRLFMRALPEQLEKWENLVNIVRSHFSTPIRFEAAVLHHDGKLLPPSIVSPEQAQALLTGHKQSWSSAAASPSRMATYMGHHRAVSYLHTNQSEISEASWKAQPVQEELFDGVGLVAVAHRLTETDDLILQTQFAIGSLVEICQHDAGLGNQPDPQRPVISVTAASMSGRIKNGGALVFNATAPKSLGGNVMVVVRATWTPIQQKTPDHIMILPVSSLIYGVSGPPPFTNTERVKGAMPGNEHEHMDDDHEPLIDEGRLHEMITNSVTPDAWDDTAEIQSMSGHMMFRGEAKTLKAVRKLVARQEQQLLQTIEVVYENGKGRITLPTLAQHGHGVRHGRETTAIAGLNTEVATKSSCHTPVVVTLFEGVQFGISSYAASQTLGARCNWSSQRIEGKPEDLRLPPMQITSRNHTGAIPEGGLATGMGPLGNETWSLRRR